MALSPPLISRSSQRSPGASLGQQGPASEGSVSLAADHSAPKGWLLERGGGYR